jgi:lysophospholipase L1-like esterase
VAAGYVVVDADVTLHTLPVINETSSGNPSAAPQMTEWQIHLQNTPVIQNIVYSVLHDIYTHGQQIGNRANVFSKVGDSITASPCMFNPLGSQGAYNLGSYAYLQPVVDYFSQTNARWGNSFVNVSLAAQTAWTTDSVLDPDYANHDLCRAAETPLACEYRLVRPSIALIMFGTNDVVRLYPSTFRQNLRQIVETSISMGVIPVLSTIPNRLDNGVYNVPAFDVPGFNRIITDTARSYYVPLWDFWNISKELPNSGLASDNLHLSAPPGVRPGRKLPTGKSLSRVRYSQSHGFADAGYIVARCHPEWIVRLSQTGNPSGDHHQHDAEDI